MGTESLPLPGNRELERLRREKAGDRGEIEEDLEIDDEYDTVKYCNRSISKEEYERMKEIIGIERKRKKSVEDLNEVKEIERKKMEKKQEVG